MWVETTSVALAYASIADKDTDILLIAGNPLDFNAFIGSMAILELEPKQTIKIKNIISTKKKEIAELMGTIMKNRNSFSA